LLAAKAKLRKSLDDNHDYDDGIKYLGVTTQFFRPMSAVEPMCVGHNYPSKEILLLRIAEEANLHNVEVAIFRSCLKRVYVNGRGGANFKVRAQPTLEKAGLCRSILDGLYQLFQLLVVLMEMTLKQVMMIMMRRRRTRRRMGRRWRRTRLTWKIKMMMIVKEMMRIFLVKRAMVMVSPSPRTGTRGTNANADHPSRASGLFPSSKSLLQSAQTFPKRSAHI
jgi:hypothetical protein